MNKKINIKIGKSDLTGTGKKGMLISPEDFKITNQEKHINTFDPSTPFFKLPGEKFDHILPFKYRQPFDK